MKKRVKRSGLTKKDKEEIAKDIVLNSIVISLIINLFFSAALAMSFHNEVASILLHH